MALASSNFFGTQMRPSLRNDSGHERKFRLKLAMNRNTHVDLLSLYASLKDETDERILQALEEVMRGGAMVHGLEKLQRILKTTQNQYVFIGGTACDILMSELGAPFRATKDLDIVLIIEALDSSFGEAFWKFIEDAGYEHREKNDERTNSIDLLNRGIRPF